MASRQQEKEARRQARLEQEAAERKAAARTKRLQYLFGGVLAVGVVGAVVLLLSLGGGNGKAGGKVKEVASTGVKLPAVQITDKKKAATAAGCTLSNPADDGRNHQERTFTGKDYKTNPPTSGTHFPVPAQDGIFEPGNEPQVGELVHSLEHGRVSVQYKPGTSPKVVKQLEQFLSESNRGYHMLLSQNNTNMKAQIAATAWDHSLTCPDVNDKVFDALRTFREAYLDRGPERVA